MARSKTLDRRTTLAILSSLGFGNVCFQRALAKDAEQEMLVTAKMIEDAEWVAGIELSEEQRRMAAHALARAQKGLQEFRSDELDNGLAPAFTFKPLERETRGSSELVREVRFSETSTLTKIASEAQTAFLPVSELSALLRSGQVSSVELTKMYLERLRRFDPLLKCVVTITEDLAMKQAKKADREIRAGRYRGPLHGIPWGAKDIFAHPDYPTTWGAPLYKEQRRAEKAAVIQRLEDAGCVLVAKLTTGYLALGDEWFGGKTRNPWNPAQGSSGSSAGSACATAAGLVGFSLGTETMGSIISPSTRCGATGLRPTFGRVSRYGCMALAWTLDKIGPICRSVEDCAVVLGAIHGRDDRDPSSVDRDYQWPAARTNHSIRVGYVQDDVKLEREIEVLRELGFELVPIQLPKTRHEDMLPILLTAESGSLFDGLTHIQEPKGVKYWPKTFVMGQFVTANDYIRANRIRRQVMEAMRELFRDVDVVVGPSMGVATNMSGHPKIAVPRGFEEHKESKRQVPNALLFTGRLYDETTLLIVANAFQRATTHHLATPPLEEFLGNLEEFADAADLANPEELFTCE